MKTIKNLLFLLLIILITNTIFAEEVIEKSGNTTKITLYGDNDTIGTNSNININNNINITPVVIENAPLYGAGTLTKSNYKYADEGGNTYSKYLARFEITLNQIATLQNLNVKMTQDDDNYKFTIKANATNTLSSYTTDTERDHISNIGTTYRYRDSKNTIHTINLSESLQSYRPMLYKTANFGNNLVIWKKWQTTVPGDASGWTSDFGEDYLKNNSNNYLYKRSFENGDVTTTTENVYDKFYIYDHIRMGDYEQTINLNSQTAYDNYANKNRDSFGYSYFSSRGNVDPDDDTKLIVDNMVNNSSEDDIDTSFTIQKQYIDDLRYLSFYFPYYTAQPESGIIKGYSLCTNTIDLKEYTNCTHSWEYSIDPDDSSNHIKKCKNCEWEIKEAHNYKYEYDGIKKDVCECGIKKQVKIHIEVNSNTLSEKVETVNINSTFTKYDNPVKLGYTFKHYKKYLIEIDGDLSETSTPIKETFINNVATMDSSSGEKSIKYIAVYEPIKYNIRFNKDNNKDLNVTVPSSINNALYDSEYNTPSITYAGYTFKGWTKTKKGSTATYLTTAKLKNMTTVSGATVDLYPVFDVNKYTFKFSKINNLNLTISSDINDLVCEYDNTYYLPDSIDITGYKFIGWTLTKNSTVVNFGANAKINNYTTENNKTYTLYPIYAAHKFEFKFSKINNLGLNITENISDLKCEYGKTYKLPNHIGINGYKFIGWTLTEKSENKNFDDLQDVSNYTIDDNKTYTLYPIYEKRKYTIKCEYSQENETKVITLNNVEVDSDTSFPIMKVLPITSTGLGWYYDDISVNSSNDLDKYITKDNMTIILKYKTSDSNDNVYTEEEFNNITYTVKCEYYSEVATKSIIYSNVTLDNNIVFPEMKILPITTVGLGWYYNDIKVESSNDLDIYVTKNNIIITLKYKVDGDVSVYTEEEYNDISYEVVCEYLQEGIIKNIILEKVVIGVKRELPKIKILPITAKGYGWYYNDKKVNDTLDLDKYITKNNERITITYKMDEGASAYEDIKDFTYTIKCEYKQENIVKTIIIDNVKIGSLKKFPILKVLPLTAKAYGWYYKENKVASSLDVDQYVTKNNEIITISYKTDNGASCYIEDDFKEIKYIIKCEYIQESETKTIEYKDVKIGTKVEFPIIKVLPLTAKSYGWYYKENKVASSLDVDQYVTKNNEMITITYKTDNGASCYIEEVEFKYQIKYLYEITLTDEEKDLVPTIDTIKIGENKDIKIPEILEKRTGRKKWFYNNNEITNTSDLDNYIKFNNETISIKFRIIHKRFSGIDSGGGVERTERIKATDILNINEYDSIKNNIETIPIKRTKNKIKKTKDIIEYLNEIYNDFKEQNNIRNEEYLKKDIITFIEEIYTDFSKKEYIAKNEIYENNRPDIIDFANSVYKDFADQNNIIYGFTNTRISTNNEIKINNTNKATKNNTSKNQTKATNSNIKKNNKYIIEDETNENQTEYLNSDDYINKIFDNYNDNKNIKDLINKLQDRNYKEIYNDINNEKYNKVLQNFLKNYQEIFNEIKTELSKNKYKEMSNELKKDFQEPKYKELTNELLEITNEYKNEWDEIKTNINKKEYEYLLRNINNGKYKDFLNECVATLTKKKYKPLIEELQNEITEGKYTDTFYDLIYFLLDITYKYDKPVIEEPIVEENIEEVNETIDETIEIIKEDNEKGKINFVLFAGIGVLISLLLLGFIVKKMLQEKEKNYE